MIGLLRRLLQAIGVSREGTQTRQLSRRVDFGIVIDEEVIGQLVGPVTIEGNVVVYGTVSGGPIEVSEGSMLYVVGAVLPDAEIIDYGIFECAWTGIDGRYECVAEVPA